MRSFFTFLFIFILLFQSCEMIEYHPYDGRVRGETDINRKNIERIETACAGKSTIRFILMSDTQRWYDETEEFVKAVNKRNDIDFVIHGGDISDFGMTKEFMWQRDILNKLKIPYVVLLGNHDCLGSGIQAFEKVFGEVNFSFIAGQTKFVCLNTNALEFDYSYLIPDFDFIEQEKTDRKDEFDKTVVAMHARPLCDQFNDKVTPFFQYSIKEFPGLQFCLHGHNHSVQENDLFNDGIMYYGICNIAKKKYYIFTLHPDETYDYEIVEF